MPDPIAPTSARPVILDHVHDGDSVEGTIDLGYGMRFRPKEGIRAFGYDCWEISGIRHTVTVTPEEIVKGKAARDDLISLLDAGGKLYAEDSGGNDPHGRASSILWVKMPDGHWLYLAAWMESRGHLRTPRAG